jgi:outer membrane protein OmpA-like peptidoglycan-associated protein
VSDTLPVGFRLRKGSVKINGVPAGDPTISADGRTLTFNIGTLAGSAVATINYVVEVTAGARLGEAINSAIANAARGVRSNNARVTITVRDDFMRTRSILMGRVSTGACNNKTGEGPNGVGDVRVYLEDGSFVISDKQGLFHFEGVRDGLHVVQLDLDSLPDGYEAFACTENSRFAGRAFSQFVETQGGTLWRTDFHIRKKQADEKPAFVPQKGEIILELANTTQGQNIAYQVTMRGSTLPVQNARLNVILPDGVLYEKGSSMMDGAVIADPLAVDNTRLAFKLGDLPAGWRHKITFRGILSRDSKSGTLVTQAYLAADGEANAAVLTPPAETIVQLDKSTEIFQMPDIVLRPHFPVRSAELNAEDRKKLDGLAGSLAGLRTEKILVTGHTDNVPIAPSHRVQYADNQALSLARARSVGHYLMDKLHIPPEKLFLDGKGSVMPIAGNNTEAGKALNRRVEVRITSTRIVDHSNLRILKEHSGEKRIQTISPKNAPQGRNDRSSMAEPIAVKQQASGAVIFTFSDADQNEDAVPPRSYSAGSGSTTANSPSAAKADAALSSPVPEVPAASDKESSEITIKDPDGILSPSDKDILINNINSVRVCLDSKLTPRLLVDKKEISEKSIGFTMKDEKAGKTIYSYIGVDFGKRGDHIVEFQGVDPFGNARFNQKISVKRSGEIVSIRFKSAQGNVADGKTPVKLWLELYDSDGTLIPAGAELEIREGTLNPLKQPDIFAAPPSVGSHPRVQMSREGDVLFQPVNQSGLYRVVLGYNNATVEAETYVQPKMRDWILAGLGEGTVGYNTLSGNMENLTNAGTDDKLYKDSRLAFFAKGQIKGKWLLTIAYDSAKTKGNTRTDGLFQTINPETYYTLYGDASQQQYDAASAKNLYIKIEREQFYALFGDYDTGLTVTELSRYSRRMTGVKTELQTKNFEVNAFASQTDQVYAKDEIPGDGTSGIYHLSHKNIMPNSDKITIEVRDRFHSEIIISSQSLASFTDYSIDYDAGTVIFKEPVYYRDQKLNPIIIVAEYETVPGSVQDYTYGGRAGVKLLDNKLKAGASYIHEGQGDQSGNLYGADTSYKLNQNTKFRAEVATSDFNDGTASRSGDAYLAEISRTTKLFDVKTYFREQTPGFGLGQQPASEAGTRKYGVEGAYRFGDSISANGDIYRQDNLVTDATRDVAEGKMNYNSKSFSAYAGVLHADDHLNDSSSHESNQLTLGGKIPTMNDRVNLTLDYAQSVGSNDNSDFPTRAALGAEYKATKNLTLLAAQEFTWGTGATTQDTRLGMRSALWNGAAMTSTVERQFNENDDRVFADVGLKQTWKINDAWKADAGLERSQTVADAKNYQINTNVPPSSGTNENFTAVSGGTTYQIKHLTWENRLEFRLADSENKWGLVSGLIKEVDSSWAWSGRAQIYQTSALAGLDTTKVDLRYGLVYRPSQTDWIALDRLDFIIDNSSGGTTGHLDSWRLVNNFITNYRPRKYMQLSLHYGAKYVLETIDGSDYSGYTDLLGVEGRYDISKDWDIGLQSSILHSWNGGQLDYSEGISVGYNVMQNAWVSLGYNLTGFDDKDFSQANYTAQGPFVHFRFKFDQESVRDAAKWLNGNGLSNSGNTELMTGKTK